jgi:hypothetical protein
MPLIRLLPAVALLMAPLGGVSAAQGTPGAIEFSAGALMFPDDGVVTEGMAGAAARFYLRPRVAVGPEFVFVQGNNHSHLMLTGNLTFDFLGPGAGRAPRVTPFLVIGGGMFQTRDQRPRGGFTSYDGAFTAGGGVRALAGDRLTVGGDARIGWELHLRVNGFVGWRF